MLGWAIVLAGGSGSRMKSLNQDLVKTFLPLEQKTIIQQSIEAFVESTWVQEIVVTLPCDQFEKYAELADSYSFGKPVHYIPGGETRQKSSWEALQKLKTLHRDQASLVAIHDAARPYVSLEEINSTFEMAQEHGAAELACPVTDTIVEVKNDCVHAVPDRSKLYAVQTPQTFQFDLIYRAHEQAQREDYHRATDDAMLVMRLGHDVKIVNGSPNNIKITHSKDYKPQST